MLTSHLFGNNVGVKHGFFPRSGGVSSFPYDSLNCGFGSGDTSENIISNRAIAMHHLDLKHQHQLKLQWHDHQFLAHQGSLII